MKAPGMRVLVVGGGAREHALVWKLHFSPQVSAIYAAPGNAGISFLARTAPVAATDVKGLVRLARENQIDLTVVGPEDSLAAGIVDTFHQAGLRIFGPTQAAARIESSKLWAKELMGRCGVPTARWAAATTPDEAYAHLEDFGVPVVLKADGLARGRGAVVCRTREQAHATIEDFMVKGLHGASGQRLVIEEYLEGVELSIFALSDGAQSLPLIAARDYKPLLDGDQGPNTGGMGGYARPAYATPELMGEVRQQILEPTLQAMAEEGAPYVGVLYAGLMITHEGPRVLEFNCRWGDPEAQLVLPLLKTDLAELMLACLDGELDHAQVQWREGATLGVVLASAGYPGPPAMGQRIAGLEELDEGILAFHAATRLATPQRARGGWLSWVPGSSREDGPGLLTDGGRVLTVVASGSTLEEARARAYANVERIRFEGMQYRGDLGAHDPTLAALTGTVTDREARPARRARPSQAPATARRAAPAAASVAILMGSESDRPIMEETAKTLESLGIAHEMHVMSAHRTPEKVREFARTAEARGVQVIIAGAGGAAHLPGVIAAQTIVPVIGVPIAGSSLLGLDSLLSIVQMPGGIPVATVAVGSAGARNAAYLAAAMIGLADEEVRERYRRFRREQSGGDLE